ncbi:MAG: hypothetical protein QXY22_01445 [Candidatus Nitrosotenuis sp.]
MRNQKLLLAAVMTAAIFWPVHGMAQNAEETQPAQIPLEDAEIAQVTQIALDFVRSSPTFAFDGMEDTLVVDSVHAMESFPVQYRVQISFDSAHGGFGDREGQVLTQVITHHKMDLLISEGIVMSAVTDGQWDELNNQFVLKHPHLPIPAQLGKQVQIGMDQSAVFESEGLQITLKRIEDSRCPSDVTCIHAGDVKAIVSVTYYDADMGQFTLINTGSGSSEEIVQRYSIMLTDVTPYPTSSQPAGDYTATILVSKTAPPSPIQQISGGILPENVLCNDGLVLIQKATKQSSACVRPETAQILAERGWLVL